MTALFRRHDSTPFAGTVESDEKGKPFHRYVSKCLRCGGAGGSDKWAHTGWTCFDCAGNGTGPTLREPLYTAEQIARMNAAAEKRAATKKAKADAAEALRREPFLAWHAANEHVLDQIVRLAPRDLIERIANDCAKFIVPPAWMLDVAIASALREGLRADIKAASEHVGKVGERVEIVLSCEKVLDYSERGSGGYLLRAFFIALMRDEAGNRVVYKGGTLPLGEGRTGRFKVTIKEHGERDGERQTVIARAKELVPQEG